MTAMRAAWREAGPLMGLATPLVIGLAASTLLGVTDTLMLAPLGEDVLGAVSLTSSLITVFYAAIYGALAVLGVGVAEAHGARAPRKIAAIVRNGFALAFAIGALGAVLMALLFFALPSVGQPPSVLAIIAPYWMAMAGLLIPFALLLVLKQMFESIERPWTGMAFAFLAVAINIPLNYVLIYGAFGAPALGLAGAGLASLIAETIAFLAALAFWRRARSTRRLRVRAAVTADEVSALAREGAPLGFLYASETAALACAGVMLGWFGATALAANQVAGAVGSVLFMLPLGMAGAVAIRLGQAKGAGAQSRLRPIAIAAMVLVTLWTLGVTIALLALANPIAHAIAPTKEVAALATGMLLVVAVMQVGDGLQSTALGALRGVRDTTWASLVSLGTYWLVSLPLAYWAAFEAEVGPTGIWIGFGAGLAIAAAALPVRFFWITRAAPRDGPAVARS